MEILRKSSLKIDALAQGLKMALSDCSTEQNSPSSKGCAAVAQDSLRNVGVKNLLIKGVPVQ